MEWRCGLKSEQPKEQSRPRLEPYPSGRKLVMAHIAKHRWWWDAAGFLIAAAGVAVLVYAVVYL